MVIQLVNTILKLKKNGANYDESMQLLFYPRVEGSESLNESLGTYYNTNKVNEIPEQLRIVHNDDEFDEEYKSFLGGFK